MSYYAPTDDLSYEPLTVEQEAALFNAFHADPHGEVGLAARDSIVQHHLKLVAKLAIRTAKGTLKEEDAIGAGNVGLMQALETKRFDPARGYRFSSYVRHFIRGAVLAEMRHSWGLPEDDHRKDIFPSDAALTGAQGRSATVLMNNSAYLVFTHVPPELSVDHGYEQQQLNEVRRDTIRKLLTHLKPLERAVVRGVCMDQRPNQEVADENDVSRQAAHAAMRRGLTKLKGLLQAHRSELY